MNTALYRIFIVMLSCCVLVSKAYTDDADFCESKINITTTTIPIASIIANVGGKFVSINTLHNESGCVYHLSFKPSQINAIKKSHLVFYIDDEFEQYMSKIKSKYNTKNVDKTIPKFIKLSDIKSLKVYDEETIKGKEVLYLNDWHIWFNIHNIIMIAKHVQEHLQQLLPNQTKYFNKRSKQFQNRIIQIYHDLNIAMREYRQYCVENDLKHLAQDYIPGFGYVGGPIFYNEFGLHSLDSRMAIFNNRIQSIDSADNSHMHIVKALSNKKCMFIDNNIDTNKIEKMFKKLKKDVKIIKIPVENWNTDQGYENLMERQFQKMIRDFNECSQ